MSANALGSGIKLLVPFLNRTLFLWLRGPKYLGLNGLFGWILGVLPLAELGFGNKIHTETKERNFDLFMRMFRLSQGV